MADKLSSLFQFWLNGLVLLCPDFLRRLFSEKIENIIILEEDKSFIAKYHHDDNSAEFSTKTFYIENEIDKAAMFDFFRKKSKDKAKLIFCLPNNIVLKRNLSLPLAVKPNIRQALAFELNRKTPFTEDQVYFDFESSEDNDKLNINLYIAPKNRADPILEKCRSLDFVFDSISIEKEDGIVPNINFIGEINKNNNNKINKVSSFLLVSTIALFFTLLYLPLYLQNQSLDILEKKVAEKRNLAIQLQTLEKEKNIIFEQSHFLANKRTEQISSIEIINEITRTIPDDTWLNRLTIKSGTVQLQGESSNATSLLQSIETSELFTNAEFRSPITKNNLTKKDRFNLSAEIFKDGSI